jgi:hypothetical protein
MNLRLERVTVTPRAGLIILLIRKATQRYGSSGM